VGEMPPEDKLVATQLIQELTDSEIQHHSFGHQQVLDLGALSTSQLKDLAALFAVPSHGQACATHLAAA
jgi:hypothetical protein